MNHPSLPDVVHTMYGAFGRGDVAGILAKLHPDVSWRLNADPAAPGAGATPILREFNGTAEVAQFFALLGREFEIHAFRPQLVAHSASEVVERVDLEVTIRSTKRRMRSEAIHLFTFDASGLVIRFREYSDTLAIAASWDAVRANR